MNNIELSIWNCLNSSSQTMILYLNNISASFYNTWYLHGSPVSSTISHQQSTCFHDRYWYFGNWNFAHFKEMTSLNIGSYLSPFIKGNEKPHLILIQAMKNHIRLISNARTPKKVLWMLNKTKTQFMYIHELTCIYMHLQRVITQSWARLFQWKKCTKA